ncbi:MAG: GntR family transcriptional regulator [Candidatus Hatepunaea meridiana]|nr:GntR family transcriptional regulator [Candidatus Hatepunaea meridiana]
MLLNLSELSSEPLHSQITRQLRAMILAGHLESGDTLPSIRAMAQEQRVSVITVQTAYDNLQREGLIHSMRVKGSIVSELTAEQRKTIAVNRLVEDLAPVLSNAQAEGLTRRKVLNTITKILKGDVE